jgi:hypothetical protein
MSNRTLPQMSGATQPAIGKNREKSLKLLARKSKMRGSPARKE